jgi:hypothetical protein
MAGRRGRRAAMAAAGLMTAASPLLLGQQVAGAAVTSANDEDSLTFVTDSGQPLTCTTSVTAQHNTDNRNQPALTWSSGRSGQGCFENVFTALTVTYKDSEGVTRTLSYGTFDAGPSGTITGAYSATSVRSDVHFFNCDEGRSATCDITVVASPK